jgi:hypothetical protein
MNTIKHKIKIKSINIDKNNFIIESENDQMFTSKIIKGSVDFKIYNENNEEVNLSNLEVGDLIQVYENIDLKPDENNEVNKLLKLLGESNYININNNFKKTEQKNSIINKIIIKNKYIFNSDSSENYDIID